ncbi:MAG: Rrf2 family transcriptional regulator [Desulfobacterales bacterium]
MFGLTSKANYGIEAVLELAGNYGNGLLQIKHISEKRHIPRQYLVQLLNRLLKAGIVRSVRGNNGGYMLNDHPDNISVLQVLELLEGEIEFGSTHSGEGAVKELYQTIEKEIRRQLDISLAAILARQQAIDETVMFYI